MKVCCFIGVLVISITIFVQESCTERIEKHRGPGQESAQPVKERPVIVAKETEHRHNVQKEEVKKQVDRQNNLNEKERADNEAQKAKQAHYVETVLGGK